LFGSADALFNWDIEPDQLGLSGHRKVLIQMDNREEMRLSRIQTV